MILRRRILNDDSFAHSLVFHAKMDSPGNFNYDEISGTFGEVNNPAKYYYDTTENAVLEETGTNRIGCQWNGLNLQLPLTLSQQITGITIICEVKPIVYGDFLRYNNFVLVGDANTDKIFLQAHDFSHTNVHPDCPIGEWSTIAAVYVTEGVKSYKNGVFQGLLDIKNTTPANFNSLVTIGCTPWVAGSGSKSFIRNLKIFNGPLSEQEIALV